MDINKWIRQNIRELQPYSCAREEYSGRKAVFLDANENPYDTGYNRYPDPYQRELKKEISRLKQLSEENIVLGNGSDEIIDLLIRSTCEPQENNILVFTPGYAMYHVCAAINGVEVREISLTPDFLPDWARMWEQRDERTRLIFLCTPNNPTGKVVPLGQIEEVARRFEGWLVVDEAYIDFAAEESAIGLLGRCPNIIVLQTLSKAWGMAGLRLGMCFAGIELVQVLNKVKAPYNISSLTQSVALQALQQYDRYKGQLMAIKAERERLQKALGTFSVFKRVYASEANFILVTTPYYRELYEELVRNQIVVRKRDIPPLIAGGLRITVGRKEENDRLLEVIAGFRYMEKIQN